MDDLQFITLADTLSLVQITDLGSSTGSRRLRLYVLPSVLYLSRVLVNDYEISTFALSGYNNVILTLPTNLSDIDITSAEIILSSSRITDTSKATLIYGTGSSKIKAVSGVQKIVQQITKILLTNIGSNRFAVEEGGNLLSNLGVATGSSVKDAVAIALSDAIKRTEAYILKKQIGLSMPSNERLLSLTLSSVIFDEFNSATARVSLRTFAGTTFTLPITV